ncbi:MAG: DUF2889 domain-containing protein [Comamonas sp.]|nr:DUF2889 domain-containing protein [Comamonas sp.]
MTLSALSAPQPDRQPRHIRRITYQSFERSDGLWDMEGELIDVKATDITLLNGKTHPAGQPIHHMQLRVTMDKQLVVHALEAAMPSHPLQGCPQALAAMQNMVGACMARGWRKAIDTHLGEIKGCTHMRELLLNMATAAFQSILSAFTTEDDQPPGFLGRCVGWDFKGPAVAEFYPKFINYERPAKTAPQSPQPQSHNKEAGKG